MFGSILTLVVALSGVAAKPTQAENYDYIIIGGGTAGSALATRLSQLLPKASIVLLEAGPAAPDELRINVPGMRGSAIGSEYDWNFTSTAQPELLPPGRSIAQPRGRVLGGSSALNYLCYDRAAKREYDVWGELMGGKGKSKSDWNWDTMIEAMLASEQFDPTVKQDGDLHGTSGPIKSTYGRIVPEMLSTWHPTMNKLGIPSNDGKSLGGTPVGVMFQPTNINTHSSPDGMHWNRSYAANSYLPLAGKNLVVRTNTRVAKIDFAEAKGKGRKCDLVAKGVTLTDGTKLTAAKEVIVSAGSVQSPGVLELSGIGQRKVLQAAGVPVLKELPGVGENLQDHIMVANIYRLKTTVNQSTIDPLIYEPTSPFTTQQLALWLQGKVSWFDYTSLGYSFLNWQQVLAVLGLSTKELSSVAAKDIPGQGGSAKRPNPVDAAKRAMLLDPAVPQLEMIMEPNFIPSPVTPYPNDGRRFFTLLQGVMRPFSRGSVHINGTTDINVKPLFDPKYLSHPFDILQMTLSARMARIVANTAPIKDLWDAEIEPGPNVTTQADFEVFARRTLGTFFHPVGTCAMLPEEDGGVVDARLKVYGTANLRVVDASIIPVILSAHTQTAVYGIAERAARFIAEAAGSKHR